MSATDYIRFQYSSGWFLQQEPGQDLWFIKGMSARRDVITSLSLPKNQMKSKHFNAARAVS